MKLAKSLDSMVTIKKADKEVDASRLLSLMGLGVRCNDEVMVCIELSLIHISEPTRH